MRHRGTDIGAIVGYRKGSIRNLVLIMRNLYQMLDF